MSIVGDKLCGCVISDRPIIEFTTTFNNNIKKTLHLLFPECTNFVHCNALKHDLIKFNDKFTFAINKMGIGLVFAFQHQHDALDMLNNKYKSISKQYKHFLELMCIDDFELDSVFDDVFENIKIKWYHSCMLDEEQTRRCVANVLCMVIYRECEGLYEPFKTSYVKNFGNMTQIFVVVEHYLHEYYRVSVFNKKTKAYYPLVPCDYLFNGSNLRDFVLTKLHNGVRVLKEDSAVAKLFLYPRQVALNELGEKVKQIHGPICGHL